MPTFTQQEPYIMCPTCNQPYNHQQAKSIINKTQESTSSIINKIHLNQCLTCIKKSLLTIADSYTIDLQESSDILYEARKAYTLATIQHNKLKSAHSRIDKQRAYLTFHLKESKPKPKKAPASKQTKSAKQAKSAIQALMQTLTPEQIEKITALATKA